MQCVTSVEGHWLAEVGDKFFSVNEGGSSRVEKRKKAVHHKTVMEEEMKRAQETIREREEEKIRVHESHRKQQIYDIGTPRVRSDIGTPRVRSERGIQIVQDDAGPPRSKSERR